MSAYSVPPQLPKRSGGMHATPIQTPSTSQRPPGARAPTNPSPIDSWKPYANDLNRYEPWVPKVPENVPPTYHNYGYDYENGSGPSTSRDQLDVNWSQQNLSRSWSHQPPLTATPESYADSGVRRVFSHQPHYLQHRASRSDVGSIADSFYSREFDFPSRSTSPDIGSELSHVADDRLQSEEGLRRFQSRELQEKDEEWHKLVPEQAKESLGKQEVQRQSVIFELFKAERDYVSDLELVQEVFVTPLVAADPPVMRREALDSFVQEVFYNICEISSQHQRMLKALFTRQREQHPLVSNIADIILDTVLKFQPQYEAYIKHYPIAEDRHRRELKRNPRYEAFIQECSARDARARKRDLITFISRPVTRLPRLSLVLEHLQKLTEKDHPDYDSMSVILSVLSDFLKSTQPGIEAAESKVKFWEFCESLKFRPGEILDLDLYDESRTLVRIGSLTRKQRSDRGFSNWSDFTVSLLDNFLLITKRENSVGHTRHHVVSRPVPLEYLRLGMANAPAESRRDDRDSENCQIMETFRTRTRLMFPFTIYHASAKAERRYTLYASTEAERKAWIDGLNHARGLRQAVQENNRWFAPDTFSDGFFRTRTALVPSDSKAAFTGKITSASSFTSGKSSWMVVGTTTGVFVAQKNERSYKKVLEIPNTVALYALSEFNRLVIFHRSSIISYSLDLLARVASGSSPPKSLDSSLERVSSRDENVTFCRAGIVYSRMLVIYGVKNFRHMEISVLEAVAPNASGAPSRRDSEQPHAFRAYGKNFYVPKDAYAATPLNKTVAVCTKDGISVVDPSNLSKSSASLVPDFSQAGSNKAMTFLKSRADASRPLGMVRSGHEELMVVYEDFGCYITKHGLPTRQSGLVKWETRADSFAFREPNLLLFSSEFIEVRSVVTGRLIQTLEGNDIRLIHSGPPQRGPIVVAMQGKKNDSEGVSDQLVELIETSELTLATPVTARTNLWDEWDM